MPGKKKKGGGGKKKGGKKKGAKAVAEKEEDLKKCRTLLKTYQHHCTLPGRIVSPDVVKLIRESIENEKPPVKFFLDGSSLAVPIVKQDRSSSASSESPPQATPSEPTTPPLPSKVLQPLVSSWVEANFNFVRCLYVWNLTLDDDAVVSLALYFESSIGPSMKVLELREAGLTPWSMNRLARSLNKGAQLTLLNLDYNRIPADNLTTLCEGLQSCSSLQTLSLNFCQIDYNCGRTLGSYIATSGVKEVSLIGNALTCYGCSELIRPLTILCSVSDPSATQEPAPKEASDSDHPVTEGEGAMAEPKQTILPAPPALTKLFLQDNCIDVHSACSVGSFSSVLCTREIKRLLTTCPGLEELNLQGNSIGDGGAREVMEGLQARKERGFAAMKMTVSSNISPDIFASILDLSASKGDKKKGKKKGKKKKK